MWLNEYEIERMVEQFADHAVLGPAVRTLHNLMTWTNRNSDGWPYWQKPGKAAAALQELLYHVDMDWRRSDEVAVTQAQVAATLRPIKAFRTRQGADFEIVTELNVHTRRPDGFLPATVKNMREHAKPGMYAYSFLTHEQSSANANDYFMSSDDTLLRDAEDEPMVLVLRHSVVTPG